MTNRISHNGIVEAIEGSRLTVRIVQTSACGACRVAGHCSAAESKVKKVEVVDSDAANRHHVGDDVVVAMPEHNGREAVVIAFVIPLAIMVAVMVGVWWASGNEPLAALCGLSGLVPYYLALFICRDKISGKFTFVIEH